MRVMAVDRILPPCLVPLFGSEAQVRFDSIAGSRATAVLLFDHQGVSRVDGS
jgi:hypothetical protein